jgi:hypothetical protein
MNLLRGYQGSSFLATPGLDDKIPLGFPGTCHKIRRRKAKPLCFLRFLLLINGLKQKMKLRLESRRRRRPRTKQNRAKQSGDDREARGIFELAQQ